MSQHNNTPPYFFSILKIIGIIGLVGVLLFTPIIPTTLDLQEAQEYDRSGIPLFRPPVEIFSVYADAPAITTTDVALFGWLDLADEYGQINDWDIYDAPAVMLNYTDHTNAVDGWVRVWDKGDAYTCTDENPDTENCFVDVQVRIRTDFVIIAYILQVQTDSLIERGTAYLWWNHSVMASGNPPTYGLAPSRAMEIVLTDGLNITIGSPPVAFSFDYSDINYYDFEFSDSDSLFIFGYTTTEDNSLDSHYWYWTVELDSTIENSIAICGWQITTASDTNTTAYIGIDGGDSAGSRGGFYDLCRTSVILAPTSLSLGWYGVDIDTYVVGAGVQATMWSYTRSTNAGRTVYNNGAVLVWSG